VDHVMALLPFEPGVHRELGGPLCSYVGHPLIEQSASLRPNASESARRETGPPVLLVLPGSRTSELHRLIDPFHAAVRLIEARMGALDLVLPTVAHLEGEVRRLTSNWERVPRVIVEAEQKRAAFRIARAALAASGTVTLELALAGVPHVVAYRMSGWEAFIIRRLARAPSVVLTNLILGQKVVPEFLQEACEPGALAQATLELLSDSPARRAQTAAFCRLDGVMASAGGAPSEQAADIVIAMALGGRDYLRREIGA
ncbi:MAG: lipid-A-disaccharide synthase, partial [Proteobacteria bacterium]|nr:lipid-A-disaccharide synthase [Pseudomonadota bacterium]